MRLSVSSARLRKDPTELVIGKSVRRWTTPQSRTPTAHEVLQVICHEENHQQIAPNMRVPGQGREQRRHNSNHKRHRDKQARSRSPALLLLIGISVAIPRRSASIVSGARTRDARRGARSAPRGPRRSLRRRGRGGRAAPSQVRRSRRGRIRRSPVAFLFVVRRRVHLSQRQNRRDGGQWLRSQNTRRSVCRRR